MQDEAYPDACRRPTFTVEIACVARPLVLAFKSTPLSMIYRSAFAGWHRPT
jgi:hypothetical protein